VDLSALAIVRGSAGWNRLVDEISLRGASARKVRLGLLHLLLRWLWPAAAMTSGAAAGVLVLAVASGSAGTAPSTEQADKVVTVLTWAQSRELPDSVAVLRVLGGDYE
jgi:hypothetical protein